MFRVLGLVLVGLGACAAPGSYFRNVPPTRVVVDGSVFDVRVRGDLAAAVRVNRQYAPRFGPIRGRAGRAMERASGCRVIEVRGDQALATGLLSCSGRSAGWEGPLVSPSYSCLEVNPWINDGPGPDYEDFDCDPI